jgi:ribulose-phosphate 3-epimerase
MKLATSILSITDNRKEKILALKDTTTDYIHLDVMDGRFVENKVSYLTEIEEIKNTNKKIDIHFMVENVDEYLEDYKVFNPEYMTFHIESNFNKETIKKIKQTSKVGIALNPETNIEKIKPYLDQIDLVLVMSVTPGKGGQLFKIETVDKIKELLPLKDKYQFEIEVDGGINDKTISMVKDVDIVVSGSYITSSNNYEEKIKNLK